MNAFRLVVRTLAFAFVAVSCLHLALGLGADATLGSPVTNAMMGEPSFDSQNRFYGVTFSLMGVCLWIASTDFERYEPILFATLGVLFAAGLARALAWALHGAPSAPIIGIAAADLMLPPILLLWYRAISGSPALDR